MIRLSILVHTQRFTFLHPDRIMDAQKRRPDHPDYDSRTLYIPPNWFKVRFGGPTASLLSLGKTRV